MNVAKTAPNTTPESEELISGSEAISHARRLADVDVITAYPIRPYDTVMQYVSQRISIGDFDRKYIVAESEHSQFEIVSTRQPSGHVSSLARAASGGYTPMKRWPSLRGCDSLWWR